MSTPVYIHACGLTTPLGIGVEVNRTAILAGDRGGISVSSELVPDRQVSIGAVKGELPEIPDRLSAFQTRNNRMMLSALEQISSSVKAAIEQYGADRVAVVMGTSTAGMSDSEDNMQVHYETGSFLPNYTYDPQEPWDLANFVAAYFDLSGIALTISTACTSSVKTLSAARRYLKQGLCDVVIIGGADTLCRFTLNGFSSLEAVSSQPCRPFAQDRDGITIGEGAGVFLVSLSPADVAVIGIGEGSDAHHISAPDPTGAGAARSMRAAVEDAGIPEKSVGYINAHGTSTPLNDAMESKAIHDVFGSDTPCSSTKALTGHLLGAAGAAELGFLYVLLCEPRDGGRLPAQVFDGAVDPELQPICFAETAHKQRSDAPYMLSNSFAFGGNNISIIACRREDVL